MDFDFELYKGKAKVIVTEESTVNAINFRTIDDVKILHKPMFKMKKDIVETLKAARSKNAQDTFIDTKNAIVKHNGVELSTGEKPFLRDCPLRESWFSYRGVPKSKTGLYEGIFAFGELVTPPHIDGGATAFCFTILKGEKEWLFWKPGKGVYGKDDSPDFYVKVKEGDTLFGPVGWWHAVRTISNGAIHVGKSDVCQQSIVNFLSSSTTLRKIGENLEEESRIILRCLGESYARTERGQYKDNKGPAFARIKQLSAIVTQGNSRRTASGRRRVTRISQRENRKRRLKENELIRKKVIGKSFRCICKQKIDIGEDRQIIQCGGCEYWLHQICVFSQGQMATAKPYNCLDCLKFIRDVQERH